MNKLIRFLLFFMLIMYAFSSRDVSAAENTRTIKVYVGQELGIESFLGAESGTYDGYTVKSSKKSVASVRNGKITVKKKGSTVITMTKAGKISEKVILKAIKPWIKVHMLDIGQGDSFLIQTVNSNILIDTGEYREYSNLKKQFGHFGVEQLDAVIVTHFDTDHFGSVQSVLRDYLKDDGIFIHPLRYSENSTYTNLQKYLLKNPVKEKVVSTYDKGKTITELGFDGMAFKLLSADVGEGTNDSSLVLRMSFFGSSWLFTGDASASVLNGVMEEYPDEIKTDVLKVSHHGSSYSNPVLFIYRAAPDYALISVGADNEYGHPSATTISRLEKYAGSIYRTDTDGTVTVTWKNGMYSVTKESVITRKTANDNIHQEDNVQERGISGHIVPDTAIIGNKKSHAYHVQSCKSLPAEQNRVYFGSIEEAEAEGYHACGNCVK